MPKYDDDFQLYPCFNGLSFGSLDDRTFEVEALVAGSKDDEKKLTGPRLVRRLGGVPGALARRELHMPDLAKPDGYKLILLFLEQKGYKKDALDKRLLANRRSTSWTDTARLLCDREHGVCRRCESWCWD